MAPLRFLWRLTRGHRLRPWRSPLVRWRIETYSGLPLESVGLAQFLRFCFHERRSLARFLLWTSEMSGHRRNHRHSGQSAQVGP
ncbi:MAG: hypothetical protein ACRD1C_06890 [Terriglobales bacterium]